MSATKPLVEKVTITLTDSAPVRVRKDQWPIIARATSERDHNNQELFVRHYLRVRQHSATDGTQDGWTPHEDMQCIVYGWMEDSHQGAHGATAGFLCKLSESAERINWVGAKISAPDWLISKCVADLPAVELE